MTSDGAARVEVVRTRSGAGVAMHAVRVPDTSHPPVLMLHGLAAGGWYFENYQRFLAARGFSSYAIDLRGRGESGTMDAIGRVGLEDYVADAREAAEELGGAPIVIGHSAGGLLAQKLAEAGLARMVVLLCSVPPRGIRFDSVQLALRQLRHLPAMIGSGSLAAHAGDLTYMALHRVPEPERAAVIARHVTDSGRVARELSLGGLRVDATRIAAPMITISASEDRFFPPRVGRQIAARYHIPYWEYAGHAHVIHMEPGWETPAADLARWIEHRLWREAHDQAYERLWQALQASIGEDVELARYDGRRLLVEVVNVDLSRYREVIYEIREVRAPGSDSYLQLGVGDVGRTLLDELVRVGDTAVR